MKTKVTELLQIEYPIIQGGMAWVAEHHLAAAVSEAGGFGLIGAASAPPEIVREEIRKAKELLMTRNNMSEEEAHRYLQKSSMDSGTNMVETAEMVLSIMAE
mgnify:FL=1